MNANGGQSRDLSGFPFIFLCKSRECRSSIKSIVLNCINKRRNLGTRVSEMCIKDENYVLWLVTLARKSNTLLSQK